MNDFDLLNSVSNNLFVAIPTEDRKDIFNSILKEYKTQKNIAKFLNVHRGNISSWINGKSRIRLKYLMKMYPKINFEKTLFFSENGQSELSRINHSIKLDSNFGRFLGHLYGDGSLVKCLSVKYTNKSSELLNDFVDSVHRTFGKIPINEYKSKDGTTNITISSVIGNFLVKIYPEIKQRKFPSFLWKSEPAIRSFLGALCDDESHINIRGRCIKISLANRDLLSDIQKCLKRLGIDTPLIRIEFKKSGDKRFIIYNLCIYRKKNFIKFYDKIELKHEKKIKALKKLLSCYPEGEYGKHELGEAILKNLSKKNKKKASQLSKELNTSLSVVCKTLRKLEKRNLVSSYVDHFLNRRNVRHKVNFWMLK